MKSRAKVISQKHIKEIPSGMFGMHRYGYLNHQIEGKKEIPPKPSRERRKMQNQSRRINRA